MSAQPNLDPRIDAYIAQARPFAQPILRHLRELIHQACPNIHETVKWSRPFFEYKGQILCNISAFNEHCSFGFWGEEIGAVLRAAHAAQPMLQPDAMGSLGRIRSLDDLPPAPRMIEWLRQAAAFIDQGQYTSPFSARSKVVKAPKPSLPLPAEFTSALQSHPAAATVFANFAPSCQREYIEWIATAKQQATRDKRIAQAIEWLSQGKQRHWKYQTS